MVLHSGRLVVRVGDVFFSICKNKMTIDLMENVDSNADAVRTSTAKNNNATQ